MFLMTAEAQVRRCMPLNSDHKKVRGGYGVGLWKTIRKLWDAVSSKLSFSVGNGKRIKFWKDKWCMDESLNVSFPLYLLCLTLKMLGWRSCGGILMKGG